MNKKAFERLIEALVTRELKRQLPKLVEQVLAENYVKKIVTERSVDHVSDRQQLSHFIGDQADEDVVPHAVENDDESIYREHPLKKESSEIVKKLLSREENPLARLYENTTPLKQREANAPHAGPSIEQLAIDPDRMRSVLKTVEKKQEKSISDPSFELDRIKRYREQLDVPVRGV